MGRAARLLALTLMFSSICVAATLHDAHANALPDHFLPWANGVSQYVSQGNNQGSHTGMEKYAWDFTGSWSVRAAVSGIVLAFTDAYSSAQGGCGLQYANYGNYVTIQTGDYVALYLHLAKDSVTGKVQVGSPVSRYAVIGLSDSTGWVCGANPAHLHYMVETNCGSWYCQSVASSFSDSNVLAQDADGVPLSGQTVISSNQADKIPATSMGAMAASDSSGNQAFYAFVPRPLDGHLILNFYSVSTAWTWFDESSPAVSANPPSVTLGGRVAQISFIDSGGVLRQYAFVSGTNGHLYADFYSTTGWQWTDQSLGVGAPGWVREVVGTASFIDSAGARNLDVFVIDSHGALWRNYGNSSTGTPQSWETVSAQLAIPSLSAGVGAIAGVATTGIHALYVFAYGSNGHLYLFVWSDQSSSWLGIDEHIESQFAGITVTGRVGVDSFVDDASVLRVYAFVIGSTGRVYVNYYDGTGVTGWHWSDQGLMNPQGTTASVGVGVTHFRGSGGINIYASVIGSDNVVYLNWLNPTWYALPTYPGLTPYTDVGATAFVNSDGSQGLYIMTTATVAWSNVERDLQLDFYSSSTHQWQALDQGSL